MANNLKLITTENFGDLSCNFYRNMNDDILLTREQIGTALEYVNPSKAIQKIHLSHKDRLESLCIRIVESRHPQIGGTGIDVETIYYTQRGIMEICRFSRQPKANQFMDWVWDIVEKYRNHEFVHISQQDNTVNEKLIELLTSMDNRLSKLEEQSNKKKLPEKKYSRWKTNTFKKLNTLLSYVNENSDENLKLSEIIHLVIGETEDTYSIELNDYTDAYKSEFDLDTTPYAIDVINHYKDIRDMFTLTLDSIMEKLHITEDTDCNGNGINRTRNIFDELAVKVAKFEEK